MSIFSNFKKLFNKNIECGDELQNHMVYLYPLKARTVHVNSHIIVPENAHAVFVCNDKVCDVLPSGKHKISGVTLPTSFAKLKLDRPNRHGNFAKKFKADVYFVNTNIFSQITFISNEPFFLKSNKFGRIKGFCEGLTDVQVSDSEKLLKTLLIDRPFVVTKEAPKLIYLLIGNAVNRMLEHSKLSFSEIILNPKILTPYFNPDINNKTGDFGIRVFNLEVTGLKLNKGLQRKVSEFISERKNYEEQFNSTGIKYNPQDLIPNKVEIGTEYNKDNGYANNQENISQNNIEPQIIRRGSVMPVQPQNAETSNYQAEKLHSEQEILHAETQKICKFCGETINSEFMFCPKCGFKQ